MSAVNLTSRLIGRPLGNKQKWLYRGVLLPVVAFVFFVVFCFNVSPFANEMSNDSSFFRMVGRGIMEGYMPYRDFFDMKGPYLFLIQYLGAAMSIGRWGFFFVEWLNFYVVVVVN